MDLYSGLTSWSSWGTPLGGSIGKALVESQAKQQEVFKQELIKALGGNTGAGVGAGASGSLGIDPNTGNAPNMETGPNTGMDPNVASAQMESSRSQRTTRVLKNPSSGTGSRTVNSASPQRSRSKINSPSFLRVQSTQDQRNRLLKSPSSGAGPRTVNGESPRRSRSKITSPSKSPSSVEGKGKVGNFPKNNPFWESKAYLR